VIRCGRAWNQSVRTDREANQPSNMINADPADHLRSGQPWRLSAYQAMRRGRLICERLRCRIAGLLSGPGGCATWRPRGEAMMGLCEITSIEKCSQVLSNTRCSFDSPVGRLRQTSWLQCSGLYALLSVRQDCWQSYFRWGSFSAP